MTGRRTRRRRGSDPDLIRREKRGMRGHIGVSLRAECAFGSVDVVSTVDGLVATSVVRGPCTKARGYQALRFSGHLIVAVLHFTSSLLIFLFFSLLFFFFGPSLCCPRYLISVCNPPFSLIFFPLLPCLRHYFSFLPFTTVLFRVSAIAPTFFFQLFPGVTST